MPAPVILAACRTPIGKFQGSLTTLSASTLAAAVIRAALDRAGIDAAHVDEVILGNVLSAGVGQAPARQAALKAGLPETVPALTINEVCGSGLKAVMLADRAVRAGDADVVVAGGMESMSRAPYLLPREATEITRAALIDSMHHDGLTCAFSGDGMGAIAESLAASDGITREQQDACALQSHQRALAAIDEGAFSAEIVPVTADGRSITQDEGPRRSTTLQKLAGLKPVFDQHGTVTAGNASMISDGAAALIVASRKFADTNGLTPLAALTASATAGMKPEDLFIAPAQAVRMVLDKSGLTTSDIDLYEINEAFAVQLLACLKRLDLTPDRVNIHGGAIALGHPIGASGARTAVTLLHAMQRHNKPRGLTTLCQGGGTAVAALFECDG
mgnify:CR=1 FL=1